MTDKDVLAIIVQHWPGVAGVAGLLLAMYGLLASNGYIDGVVHRSEFNVFKEQHDELKATVSEIRSDVKLLLLRQREVKVP